MCTFLKVNATEFLLNFKVNVNSYSKEKLYLNQIVETEWEKRNNGHHISDEMFNETFILLMYKLLIEFNKSIHTNILFETEISVSRVDLPIRKNKR